MYRIGSAGQKRAVTSNGSSRVWPGRRTPRRATVILAAAGLVVVCLIVVVMATRSAGGTGARGLGLGTRTISVTAGSRGPGPETRTVDLEAVPGQLIITGSGTGQIRLTGQLHWTGHAPYASVRTAAAQHTLHLDYVCAAGSPCTEDYRLSVPAGTAVVLSQPSGHVIISGLAAALRITAASVDVSAAGLRSPSLVASITSGHLSVVFARAPRRVSLALTSAQATVKLPGTSPGYQVSQQVVSGYVHVGVAQATSSPHQVQAQISSGELELLP